MPIYEFRCIDCDRSFETFARPRHGDDDARCPGCGSGQLVREMSTFSAHASASDTAAVARDAIMASGSGRAGGGGCCGGGCGCH